MTYLQRPPKDWMPPFCPNENCKFHIPLQKKWSYKSFGSYYRTSDNRRVQRYQCLSCNRTFSSQTFSTTYWQKRPDLDVGIFSRTINGMANRQIARDMEIDPTTVDRKIARLGRHCLLFHMQMIKSGPAATKIVFDGLETFEYSQYFPFHINVAVEKGTDFVLFFNDSELRRKGRKTKIQQKKVQKLEKTFGRPDPKAIQKATAEVFSVVIEPCQSVDLFTDDHHQYRKPIRNLGSNISHFVTPGKEHRDSRNQLWEVNLFDMFVRHSCKNHTRETIAFSKRRQASAERMAIFIVGRNYTMRRRQKDRRSPTPAMARGMLETTMSIDEILGYRLFISHQKLPKSWNDYYWRLVSTRVLSNERHHILKYAR